jgi:hypothetical protein
MDAAITPLQAPVIGKGIATSMAKPRASYFCTASAFLLVSSKIRSKKADQNLNFLKAALTGSNRKSAGATIRELPKTEIQKAFHRLIPNDNPRGIPPLSSDTGRADTIMTM